MEQEKEILQLMIKVAVLEEKLVGSDRALQLSDRRLTEWQHTSNEWRKENLDQRALYMTTDMASGKFTASDIRIAALEKTKNEDVGEHKGKTDLWGYIMGVVGVVALIISFLKH